MPRPENTVTVRVTSVALHASPTVVRTGESVTFAMQFRTYDPAIHYRVRFGDGSRSEWSPSARATHAYSNPGEYTANAEIGRLTRRRTADQATIVPVTTSGSVTIRVEESQTFQIPPPELSAHPDDVQRDEPVTFITRFSAAGPRIRYRLSFGDDSSTNWMDSPEVTHVYSQPGEYTAYSEVGQIIGPFGSMDIRVLATSNAIRVRVSPPVEVTPPVEDADRPPPQFEGPPPQLSAVPSEIGVGELVSFETVFRSREPVLYRIVFGDGFDSGWTTRPRATHAYARAGSYAAYVELLPSGRRDGPAIVSPVIAVSVVAVSGNGVAWGVYAAVGLALVLAGYTTKKWMFHAKPRFEVHRDSGTACVPAGELEIDFEVVLDPAIDSLVECRIEPDNSELIDVQRGRYE